MKMVKIFINEKCPKCPEAKALGVQLHGEGVDVQLFNVDAVDGLAEAALNRILATPSVLIVDGESETVIHGWRGIAPGADEVLHALR